MPKGPPVKRGRPPNTITNQAPAPQVKRAKVEVKPVGRSVTTTKAVNWEHIDVLQKEKGNYNNFKNKDWVH